MLKRREGENTSTVIFLFIQQRNKYDWMIFALYFYLFIL